jgi:electron transfer flavoprotein alpha subunit
MERDDSRKGEVIPAKIEIDLSKVRTKIVETIKEEVTGIKLEDAPVIVAGGRGLGGPEPFKTTLKELADVLHGAVGATRPPADNGWVPEAMHIGLTGKIVAPDVYIAVAVSGASQHIAGCSGSKNIIAINKDPEANIFKEAKFGVVGKYEEVVPAFTNKLKEILAG